MACEWEDFLKLLPAWMQEPVNRLGKDRLQELRLRRGQPPELILRGDRLWLRQPVRQQDLDFCVNAATRYSPWSAATSGQGYLTAPGGHRIGLCGEAVLKDGVLTGFREISSLCIRVARDFSGIGKPAAELPGSVLILGAPGWGKTTLLRDLIRLRSGRETVCVVDERHELFPEGIPRGPQTDVLTGCPKDRGILQALKTMGPDVIAVDEVTAPEDCSAICRASRCGVSLLATVHGVSLEDLKSSSFLRPLTDVQIFDHALILRKDQTYRMERMKS